MRFTKGSATPLRSARYSWDRVTTCKHFFPCKGLTDGNLVDVKGGVIAAPQTGYEFVYDSDKYAVSSTATSGAATQDCVSGSFEPLYMDKYILIFYAGYVPAAAHMRVSFGNIDSSSSAGGMGLSDGSTDPICAHAAIGRTDINLGSQAYTSHDSGTLESLGTTIFNALGANGHFWRYALWHPADGNIYSAAYRTDTGALLRTNPQHTEVGAAPPDMAIPAKFRMANSAQTVIARFDFDTLPTDYLLAMHSMAAASRDGNSVVWPYWD